jgi:hypothetical protein
MSKKIILSLASIHLLLLLLAATDLSIISWAWGNRTWKFDFFSYAYHHGWGYPFKSDYTLHQVLLYLAAYALGTIVSLVMWTRLRATLARLTMIICAIGTASFALELTHWVWDHHLSLIGSFPIVLIVIWIGIGAQLALRQSRNRQPIPQLEN